MCFLIYKLKDLLITIAMNNTIHVNLSKVVLIVIMGPLKYVIKNKVGGAKVCYLARYGEIRSPMS